MLRRAAQRVTVAALAATVLTAQTGNEVKLENPLARVLRLTAQPHQPSGPREHTMNRVLVFRDPGRIKVTTGSKVETLEVKSGEVRWDPAGAPYVSENVTDHPIEIVEIELRNTPKVPPLVLPAIDPTTADADHYIVALENDQVRVLRVHYGPHEKGALHQHVRGRVVVNLSPQLRARFGDVRMSGAETHSEENATDQAVDRLAVELK
jgi:mannose-6-phosphate isomerase-like protein (cupin superfamily)